MAEIENPFEKILHELSKLEPDEVLSRGLAEPVRKDDFIKAILTIASMSMNQMLLQAEMKVGAIDEIRALIEKISDGAGGLLKIARHNAPEVFDAAFGASET